MPPPIRGNLEGILHPNRRGVGNWSAAQQIPVTGAHPLSSQSNEKFHLCCRPVRS
jgi:hypothetical protein